MDKDEQLLRKRIVELAGQAYRRDIPLYTEFLTLSEQAVFHSVSRELIPVRVLLTGGYPLAERKIVYFLSSYEEPDTACPPVRTLFVKPVSPRFAETLTHRDYLGALMNLGARREVVGDLVMQENGCLFFCLDKIADYLIQEFVSVRHTRVTCSYYEKTSSGSEDGKELVVSPRETVRGSVASPRLDSVTAMVFRTSRAKILPLIEGEKVFIDGRPAASPSVRLKGGEVISVRGMGKFSYVGMEHETKKGRVFVTADRYE